MESGLIFVLCVFKSDTDDEKFILKSVESTREESMNRL